MNTRRLFYKMDFLGCSLKTTERSSEDCCCFYFENEEISWIQKDVREYVINLMPMCIKNAYIHNRIY